MVTRRGLSRIAHAAMAAILIVATLVGAASAGTFEDGLAAYKRGDYAATLPLLRPLSEQGDAAAQLILGSMYYYGRGVPQDYSEALLWYRKAADQGEAKAQDDLGSMYYYCRGVPQDYSEAARWYRLAANQGLARAEYDL